MKDLSRKERLEQRIEELEQLISNKAYAYGDKKWLRIKRTFFAICGAIYLLLLWLLLEKGISIGDLIKIDINIKDIETILHLIFLLTFGVGFLAVTIMFVSLGVWTYVLDKTVKERIEIAKLEGELNAIESEKRNNLEDEKIEELERHIEFLENYQEKLIEKNVDLRLNKIFDDEVK